MAPILAHELAEIVEMRMILEIPAARFAAERGSDEERAALLQACETFRDCVHAKNVQGVLDGDAAIHNLIGAMARNSILAEASDRLASLSQRIWWLSVQSAVGEAAFATCHDELTRTISSGKAAAAARAAADHVALFQVRLGRLVQAVPSAPRRMTDTSSLGVRTESPARPSAKRASQAAPKSRRASRLR